MILIGLIKVGVCMSHAEHMIKHGVQAVKGVLSSGDNYNDNNPQYAALTF